MSRKAANRASHAPEDYCLEQTSEVGGGDIGAELNGMLARQTCAFGSVGKQFVEDAGVVGGHVGAETRDFE